MTVKFQLGVYIGAALHERNHFDRLWSLFAESTVGATTWGRQERTTEAFASESGAAFDVLAAAGWLFVSGAKNGFRSMVRRWRGNLYEVDIWIAASAMESKITREKWLAWMFHLIETEPILFGHGETGPENDAKHLVDTGERKTWLGTSYAELHRFLPGIYWLTAFGRELGEALPFEQLSRTSGVTIRRMEGGKVVLVLDEPPSAPDLEARLGVERRIATALGDDLFYDRARPDRPLRAEPAFVAALERLKEEAG